MSQSKPSLLAPLTGVVMGVGVFLGVNIVVGRAVIPTPESVTSMQHGLSQPHYAVAEAPGAGATGGTFQTVCQTCHQADGKGLPGAFPPLAGSEWVTADPETPIRVVLLGLTGAIEVKGTKFASTMPPPPGLTDEQIAEAVSFARTNFGNSAGAVDAALVKKVRASLAGRTTSWSASELSALRSAEAPAAAPAAADAQAPAVEPEAQPAAQPAKAAPKAARAPAKAP